MSVFAVPGNVVGNHAQEARIELKRHVENLIPEPDHLPACILGLSGSQDFLENVQKITCNKKGKDNGEEVTSRTEERIDEEKGEGYGGEAADRKSNSKCTEFALWLRLLAVFVFSFTIQIVQFFFALNLFQQSSSSIDIGQMGRWITTGHYVWLNPGNGSHHFSGNDFETFMKNNRNFDVDVMNNEDVAIAPCHFLSHFLSCHFGVMLVMATTLNDFVDKFYVYEYHFTPSIGATDHRCRRTMRQVLAIYILIGQIAINIFVVVVCAKQIAAVATEISSVILAAVEAHFILEIDDLFVPGLNKFFCIQGYDDNVGIHMVTVHTDYSPWVYSLLVYLCMRRCAQRW